MILNLQRLKENVAICIAAAATTGAALYITLNLEIAERYSDFIVGHLTWRAESKIQDLIAIPLVIFVIITSALIFSLLFRGRSSSYNAPDAAEHASQLIWWSVGPAMAVTALAIYGAIDRHLYAVLLSSLIGFGAVGGAARYRGIKAQTVDISLFLLSAMLISLIPLEVALTISRAPKEWVGEINTNHIAYRLPLSFAITTSLAMIWGLFAPQTLRRAVPYIALLAQLGLPLFYVSLFPSRLAPPNGALFRYETGTALLLIIGLLIALSMFDVISRFMRHSSKPGDHLRQLFSPLALFGLMIGLKFGVTVTPSISPDDYHFGEALLGSLVYAGGGIPYIDYMPPHGFVENDLPTLFGQLIHDGSASGLADADRILMALFALVGFLSIYWLTGSFILAFVCIFLLWGRLTFFFFIPFVCLWLSPRLMANPAHWLTAWMLTAPIVVLGIPPQGAILVASSGLIALWMTWTLLKQQTRSDIGLVAVAFIASTIVLFSTPVLSMVIEAIRYVYENGPINQVAYGIPWELSWRPKRGYGFGFEILRNGWAIATLIFIIIAVAGWYQGKIRQLTLPALVALTFCLLLIPYTMGRIDPNALSRSGRVTSFACIILVPLVAWFAVPRSLRPILVLGVSVFGALLQPNSISLHNLRAATLDRVHTGHLVDAAHTGLHGIKRAAMDPGHLNGLQRLLALLERELDPGESYLDLSSRNAHYYYMNRRPLIPITAPYNLAPISQQQRIVEILSKQPPRLALMEANNINHDGGGLALRNPVLHRFVLENYLPSYQNGFVVGHLQESIDLSTPSVTIEIRSITDTNWDHGFQRGANGLAVDDPFAIRMMAVGDQIRFANTEQRTITAINLESASVSLDGPNPLNHTEITTFVWDVAPERRAAYRSALLDHAFETRDLKQIPVAWGRSEASLRHRMMPQHTIASQPQALSGMVPESRRLRITGSDPFAIYDLRSKGISGRDAGLLRLEFKCHRQREAPRLQVFWWGDGGTGPTEANSLRLTAASGVLIIPLDAVHRWTSTKNVSGIRIDLDNPSACAAIRISDIGLFTRDMN